MSEAFHGILENLDMSCRPREKGRRSQVTPITDVCGKNTQNLIRFSNTKTIFLIIHKLVK